MYNMWVDIWYIMICALYSWYKMTRWSTGLGEMWQQWYQWHKPVLTMECRNCANNWVTHCIICFNGPLFASFAATGVNMIPLRFEALDIGYYLERWTNIRCNPYKNWYKTDYVMYIEYGRTRSAVIKAAGHERMPSDLQQSIIQIPHATVPKGLYNLCIDSPAQQGT